MNTYSSTIKLTANVFEKSYKAVNVAITNKADLTFSKVFYSSIVSPAGNDHGCYFSKFDKNQSPNDTSIIELGEFSISDPKVIKGFQIDTKGYVNDAWAIAIGKTLPERIIYELPREYQWDHFNISEKVTAAVTDTQFKVFVIVHQEYAQSNDWSSLISGSPLATVQEVQGNMNSECSANDAEVQEFTDGFYANNLTIKMLFE